AYGSPRTEGDIEAYYTHIRGGRVPSPGSLEELRERYRAIGGSPLEAITRRQATALGQRLGLPTFAGMKHAPPFIDEAVGEARAAGVERLLESCRLVADGLELPPWEFAYQSASTTGEPWLGPDLLTAIERSGARRVVVCPIGFVADHLEILYDVDVEAQAFCRERGIQLRRTPSFNDRPDFIDAMAAVVRDGLAAALPC